MRTSLKLVVAIAVVVGFGALLAGSAQKLSHQRARRVSTTVPSDHSQLKGDLELRSFSRHRQFHGSFPALAGDVIRIPDSGAESERLFQNSYFGRTAPVPFSLYQRPPPV